MTTPQNDTEEYLYSLRASCEQRRIPLISPQTQDFLERILKEKQPKVCLEIGTAVGYSSLFIANLIRERGGYLYSFEIGYHAYLEALSHVQKTKSPNITLYPFDINNLTVENLLPNTIDFVFIDAQKSQYGMYTEKIQHVMSPENTIILDDVIKYQNKLTSLYEFISKKQIHYEIFETEPGDGVMKIENPPKK